MLKRKKDCERNKGFSQSMREVYYYYFAEILKGGVRR